MITKAAAVALFILVAVVVPHSAPRTEQAAQAAPSTGSVWSGVFTEEQARRGQALYSRECAVCHGSDMAGADEVPALSGPAFLANWDGLTMNDLFERIRVSMPPNKQGRLSRQQIVDLLSHLLNVNGFPAGKSELDPKAEMLKQIYIVATKPTTAGLKDTGATYENTVSRPARRPLAVEDSMPAAYDAASVLTR
jgi:S-disulfanyl-L-cysteine oxidoreductase SoxD